MAGMALRQPQGVGRHVVVLWIEDGVLRINTTAVQGAVLQIGLPSADEGRIG
jgi:hypothetical protein